MVYPIASKEIDNIWKDFPPCPSPPDPDYPKIDLVDLAQYTWDELVNYMGMYPDHAVAIFDYGKKQPHLWPNIPRIDTEAELVAWHNKNFPTTPIPQPRQVIHANLLTQPTRSPIDALIKNDKMHALIRLHKAGRWLNPHGFTRQCSYLYLAWNNGRPRDQGPSLLTFHYILYVCKRNREWAFEHPNAPALTRTGIGIRPLPTHLDFIIRHNIEAFFRLRPHLDSVGPGPLDLAPAPAGKPVLRPESLSYLLEHVTLWCMRTLRERHHLALATQAPNPWHAAVENNDPIS
ncbi:hypothetical protein BDW74DRAFT_182794 [Aspergillus multicolor]|uniref:uncharacterized protein n=1 Tax=Aspergillus multicolor TaxID=41759 RepID=UPI003CCDB069